MTDQRPQSGERAISELQISTCRCLAQILEKRRNLDWLRLNRPEWLALPGQRELLYGVLRHYLSQRHRVSGLLAKPLRSKDSIIMYLLIVGAYQLRYAKAPAYAIIDSCVNACAPLSRPWAKGLVNGLLRRLDTETPRPEDAPTQEELSLLASQDHPAWMLNLIQATYPTCAEALMMANNERAPMTLRANATSQTRDQYVARLSEAGILHRTMEQDSAIVLTSPQPAASLPDWREGACAVQDLSAQFAAPKLMEFLRESQNPEVAPVVLDACAAPGGKLFHLYEALCASFATFQLFAIDNVPQRIEDLTSVGERLGHLPDDRVDIRCLDASRLEDGDLPTFDAILLDAPCSGSGTMRRNPDIRLLLTPERLIEHSALQLKLLQQLWQRLRSGGTLLYCTCSMFEEENDQVIQAFSQDTSDAQPLSLQLSRGQATAAGWQLLPTDSMTDGFYYAALRKADTA